jgi:uncharacterized protein
LLHRLSVTVRSSERLYGWITNHPRLGPHLHRFNEERAMTPRAKFTVLALAWIMLLGAAFFLVESLFMQVFLVALAIAKTIVIARLKTTTG